MLNANGKSRQRKGAGRAAILVSGLFAFIGCNAGTASQPAGTQSPSQSEGSEPTAGVQGEYAIGLLAVASGQAAPVGQAAIWGAELAAAEINASGGVDGHSLRIVVEDTQLQPPLAVSQMQKMVSVDGIRMVIAQATPVVKALVQVAADTKTVLLNHAAVDPTIANADGYVFSTIANSDQEASALARYVYENTGVKKLAILADASGLGKSEADSLTAAFTSLGGTVVANETFPSGASDYRAQLIRIQREAPDGIYIAPTGGQGGPIIVNQIRELGLTVKVFGPTWIEDPILIEQAGEGAEGLIYSHVGFDPDRNDKSKGLQVEWAKDHEGPVSIYAATAYDSVYLLAEGIKTAGYDATAVRDFLIDAKLEGATGELAFDDKGQISMPVDIKAVKDGAFVILEAG